MKRLAAATGDLMLWLSGADERVLAECPTERRKFVATGGVVLMAAGFAVLAATFTLRDFLRVSAPLAVLVGIAWGVAIMNLDRWLLISIRRQRTPTLTVAMALPRLFLAVMVGLVVAQPLVLWVFGPEVEHQATRDKKAQLAADQTSLTAQSSDIGKLQAQRRELQETLAGGATGATVSKDSQYRELSAKLAGEERRAHEAQAGVTCEIAGKCGSDERGEGPVTHRKQHVLEGIEARVTSLSRQREGLIARLTAEERKTVGRHQGFASPQLTAVEAKLKVRERQLAEAQAEYVHESKSHPGLLDRVEALSHLTAKHESVRNIAWLLGLLILAIDSLPAFVKTIQSLGRPSLYEQVLDELESQAHAAVASQAEAMTDANQVRAETTVRAAEARRDLELAARRELTEKTVAAQKEVAERFIAAWRQTMVPLAEKWAERWAEEYKNGASAEEADAATNGSRTPGWTDGTVDWEGYRRARDRP